MKIKMRFIQSISQIVIRTDLTRVDTAFIFLSSLIIKELSASYPATISIEPTN